MVSVRPPSHLPTDPRPTGDRGGGGRLNLLLSYAGWENESWADRLPKLLEPMGVRAWRASSGAEATTLIQQFPVHIAVVDLSLPLQPDGPASDEGGPRLLDLLARLDQPPPTVVVKRRRTRREDARQLSSALSAGAFAVLEPPVNLEMALEVMRRVLCRHYADRWPHSPPSPNQGNPPKPRQSP